MRRLQNIKRRNHHVESQSFERQPCDRRDAFRSTERIRHFGAQLAIGYMKMQKKPSSIEGVNWLDAAFGRKGCDIPPALNSERAKDLIARALLQPGSLSPEEVQELAASALRRLVADAER